MSSPLSLTALLRRFRPGLPQPKWLADDLFTLDKLRFHCAMDTNVRIPGTHVKILKTRAFVETYLQLLACHRPKRILEFGIWRGGSALFLAKAARPERLVGIDLRADLPGLRKIIKKHGESSRIALFFETSQDDRPAVRGIIEREFGARPLDLIIDDASHLYPPTKASFEASFGYLKPGGLYAIEDWGWAHWPGVWQTPEAQWHDQPAMSNLIFEIVIAAASRPDIIAKVEIVSHALVIVTRGAGLDHGEAIDLGSYCFTRDRSISQI